MNQIRIGAILSYISILLTFAVGLIYTPLLIRGLGQSDYGLYSLILAVSSYLSLLDLGVGNAIVRYIARSRAIKDTELESNGVSEPFVRNKGMKISLFDIADFHNPKEKDTVIIGGEGTQSPIQYNHKALFVHNLNVSWLIFYLIVRIC